MSWKLDEFFAALEDEFRISFGEADREFLSTPGSLIDYIASETSPGDDADDEQHRDEIVGTVAELLESTLGITRWTEDSRFLEDLKL